MAMYLAKRLLAVLFAALLCACSSDTAHRSDESDARFEQMLTVPLNEHLTLTARYNAEADSVAIEVQNQSKQSICFDDQSFSVASFVINPETGQWEEFDLGFYVGDPQPKAIPPDSSPRDGYYPVPTLYADINEKTRLRFLVVGCLGELCRPGVTRVGAYANVWVGPMDKSQ
jgi:hypothetical protein